jgi:hypothetical protein
MFVALLALVVGNMSATAYAATGSGPGEGVGWTQPQVLTFVGPAGEQVAVFCVNNEVSFTAQFVAEHSVPTIGAAPGHIACDVASIVNVMPGYRLVMNTNPVEGWMITYDSAYPLVMQCRGVVLAQVWVDEGGFNFKEAYAEGCADATHKGT